MKPLTLLAALTLLASCGNTNPLDDTANECGLDINDTTITVDTKGTEDTNGDTIEQLACLLIATETPDWVISRIDQTRALDGTQEAEWDTYQAFWSYHPDHGLAFTLYEP